MGTFWNDLKCLILQKAVYGKVYKGHKPNSFEPWKKPGGMALDGGVVCQNDISYGDTYPNSHFDLWYPDSSGEKRPTFVYFHGGGFLFGDKSTGDPLAAGEGGSGKLRKIVDAGYNLVNANYALAPEFRFPVQIEQTDQLMRYLMEHAEKLHLDMTRVILGGGSAGADMTEIYGACVANPDYARELGIRPVMTPEQLRVLAIDEAALDSRSFDDKIFTMLLCWLGEGRRDYVGKLALMNAKEHIRDAYIPSWINTSNCGEYFVREAVDLAAKLESIGCEHELVYFTKEQADLDHGYMDLLDKNEFAKEAFERMMLFIKEHI